MKKLTSLFSILTLSMVLFFSCKGEDDFSTLTNEQKITLLTSFTWVEESPSTMANTVIVEVPIEKDMCANSIVFNGTTEGTIVYYDVYGENCELTEVDSSENYTYDPSTNKITLISNNNTVNSNKGISNLVINENQETLNIEITGNSLKIGEDTYIKGEQKK